MTRETLDETVDRVAAEITAVPTDETFVARLRPRLEGSAGDGVGLRTLAAAACLLALAVAAVLVRNNASATRPLPTAVRSTSARPTAVETSRAEAEMSKAAGAAITAPNRAERAVSTGVEMEAAAGESAIPALAPPRELDVAHLQLDPLVVHPVDVSTIEIAELSVTDLGASEEPKE